MGLRWYHLVVDASDPSSLARWWADVLGWDVIYEDEDETDIAPAWASDEQLPWERQRPQLVFVPVPEDKTTKNRLHLDLAPHLDDDRDAEIQRLLERGATRVDVGQGPDVSWEVLADPEGNEFCVLSARRE
jgi:predicted enzyme related to lactoylglutathione lyase